MRCGRVGPYPEWPAAEGGGHCRLPAGGFRGAAGADWEPEPLAGRIGR